MTAGAGRVAAPEEEARQGKEQGKMKTAKEQLEAERDEQMALVERASRLARKTGANIWHRIAVEGCREVARLTEAIESQD